MARPVSKFVQSLSAEQIQQLRDTWHGHRLHSVRIRAHAVLLSHQGFTPAGLAEIFDVKADTARGWIDRFNQHGCDGLEDQSRPGGPQALDEQEQQVLRELLETYPNRTSVVLAKLRAMTGKVISRSSLGRYARRFGLTWKRFRKSMKHRRNQREFELAQQELAELIAEPSLEVAYFDEAAMTLRAVVPYGWQPRGERATVPVSGSSQPSLQLLGIQEASDTVTCYLHQGTVTSQTVIEVLNDYAAQLKRPTVLVLDNASVHTSAGFRSQLEHWAAQGLYVYFLPPYSPELNRIERFWKKLKYQLMPPDAWDRFTDLLECVTACLHAVGTPIIMPTVKVSPANS